VRDHGQGLSVRVIMDRGELERAATGLDVLVIDDVMRTFSISDVARAQDHGTHVVGLFDQGSGVGREYLVGLGVDETLSATTPPAELSAHLLRLGPRRGSSATTSGRAAFAFGTAAGRPARHRGKLNAWTKVSGGSGLTEAVVAAAEHMSKRARVLLVEAEELSPILVSGPARGAVGAAGGRYGPGRPLRRDLRVARCPATSQPRPSERVIDRGA
jgi:hypothetical protein